MNINIKEFLPVVCRIAMLVAFYFIYQTVFPLLFVFWLPQEWALSLGIFFSTVAMLFHLLFFGYYRVGRNPLHEVGGRVLLYSVGLVFSTMFVMNVVAQWLGLEDNMEGVFEGLTANPVGLFSVALLAPVLEEVFFRGAVQGALMRRFSNPWVGIFTASLIFGILHMNPVQTFYATCIGVVFGWIYYRTGSLVPVIIGHVLNNSLASLVMLTVDGSVEPIESNMSQEAFSAGLMLAVALLFAYKINRWQPSVPSPWHDAGESSAAME